MSEEIHEVIAGQRAAYCVGAPSAEPDAARCIVPGSFNPLHRGHLEMAAFVAEKYRASVDFELSITNVDKPALTFEALSRRLEQFGCERIWLTQAPTFAEKAKLFPNCRFVIGADTAVRLFQRKYYQSEPARDDVIATLRKQGCQFVVFGRNIEDRFVDTSSLPIPKSVVHLFELVPEVSFRIDVSSTEMRSKLNSD